MRQQSTKRNTEEAKLAYLFFIHLNFYLFNFKIVLLQPTLK